MKDSKKKLYKFFRINILKLTLVLAVFFLGFFLRIIYLKQNALSFAYDQARDAFVVKEILQGDFKILGPPVSGVPGLYHGVMFYYLLAAGYIIGNGSPLGAAYLFSLLTSLTVFVVFVFTYLLTRNFVPSIIASVLYAFSFEASQYSNLLTNVSMALLYVPILYLGLYLWITKQFKPGPLITGFFLGFAVQSEIALLYHLPTVLFWLYFFRKKITKSEFFNFLMFFGLAVSPLVFAEIKFGFKGISGVIYLLSGQDKISNAIELGGFLVVFLNHIGSTLANNLFPINLAFGGLIGLSALLFSLREGLKINTPSKPDWRVFLSSYILAPVVALPFGGSNMRHFMVGASGGIAVFSAIFLWSYLRNKKLIMFLIVICLIITNMFKILTENKSGQTIFPLQRDLTLANELKVVDYTYETANGESFSINTLTSPLYVNTLWSFLYGWYGKNKYGYLPYWEGKDQTGQPGDNLLAVPKNVRTHYYIVEPTYGIPERFVIEDLQKENSISETVDETNFGELVVQKRVLK